SNQKSNRPCGLSIVNHEQLVGGLETICRKILFYPFCVPCGLCGNNSLCPLRLPFHAASQVHKKAAPIVGAAFVIIETIIPVWVLPASLRLPRRRHVAGQPDLLRVLRHPGPPVPPSTVRWSNWRP